MLVITNAVYSSSNFLSASDILQLAHGAKNEQIPQRYTIDYIDKPER